MAEVKWTPQALDDLEAICLFIARDYPRFAAVTADRAFAATDSLVDHPRSRRAVPELACDEIREILLGDYRLIYRIAGEEVQVIARQARAGGPKPEVQAAVAVLTPVGDSGVEGTVRFERRCDAVHVTGEVRGLEPGLHGFHVHEHRDLSDSSEGQSAGGHFAPLGQSHGRPSDEERHVGDLGNIEADESGTARIDLTDEVIQLGGAHSIIGRALVVHEQADQFVQPSGDAGGRVAFGVIGIAEPGTASSR